MWQAEAEFFSRDSTSARHFPMRCDAAHAGRQCRQHCIMGIARPQQFLQHASDGIRGLYGMMHNFAGGVRSCSAACQSSEVLRLWQSNTSQMIFCHLTC